MQSAQALALILANTIMTGQYSRGLGQIASEYTKFGHEEILRPMRSASRLAGHHVTPETMSSLGDGKTPASALAIASCALQSSEGRFDEALRVAVSHPGNRVVTGALAGAIIGADFEGIDTIPPDWIRSFARVLDDFVVVPRPEAGGNSREENFGLCS
ncbi:hypothetical protein E1161_16840 [Saccharopolyspora aridisoli]|uniref:ADP-ribosylglycohydrolase family protein n=1 Tax=Saccharopolyspora aridisoli TaxID=2530385 RepID=A0A4R4ULK3_9PSEU|nr:ADP-ribosylglycohydrolase family protein [Saccharopolyspora aridisoli]TDC91106.1 hypothetical protein E1161_16840 [Saccharopolyspora aridisoli]